MMTPTRPDEFFVGYRVAVPSSHCGHSCGALDRDGMRIDITSCSSAGATAQRQPRREAQALHAIPF